ncbi:hypothetical protein N566_02835 [Streptomycetaceae bacterium MP113-05]|nr:hypothetical protein N566_02835 [Streptomycetaceae bacterium MP113-05]
MNRRLSLVAFALVSTLLTSGCGQETVEDGEGSTGAGASPSTSAEAPPDRSADAPADTSARTIEGDEQGDAAGTAKLSSVRVTEHDAFDRVRFEFGGGVSKVFAEYMDELRGPGRGKKIELAGEHKLVLVFVGVARQDPDVTVDPTGTVRQVRASGVFEGEMIVGVGLGTEGDGPAGYRVETEGSSVTVEIAHRAAPRKRSN